MRTPLDTRAQVQSLHAHPHNSRGEGWVEVVSILGRHKNTLKGAIIYLSMYTRM